MAALAGVRSWPRITLCIVSLLIAVPLLTGCPGSDDDAPVQPVDTTAFKAKVARECGLQEAQLYDESVTNDGAYWSWTDQGGLTHTAGLSFNGYGLTCGR